MSFPRIGRLPLLALLACLPWTHSAAQEMELLSEESGGFLELEGERYLEVEGLRGELNLHLGKSGELRFAAREVEDSSIEKGVALWVTDTTLRFTPLEGRAEEPVRLDISVPSELRVRMTTTDAAVDLTGMHDLVIVRGERLDLIVRSIAGHLELDLDESTVSVRSVSEGLELDGEEIDGYFEMINGETTFSVEGGVLEFNNVNGALVGEVENVELILDNVKQRMRIDASGQAVSIGGCQAGAELTLSGTLLDIQECVGGITVETDADVRFSNHDGALKVVSRGGDVRGSGMKSGALEIESADGVIQLDNIESDTMLSGDGLEIEVKNPKGELTVNARSSTIRVENASKSVTVQNDYGDVEVVGADDKVRVFNTSGEVRLDGLKGAIEVKASGPSVDAVWISFAGVEASTIENIGGDVSIRLPGSLRARIDGEAPRGQIDSDLEDIVISDDGHYASGLLQGGKGAAPQLKVPTIRARSAGDLYIYTTRIGGDD